MSTRCRIGVEHDEQIESIYCHNDGYPEYVGKKLLKYYNTPEKARKLLELGDISSIGNDLPYEGLTFEEYTEGRFCRPYSLRGEDCPSKKHDCVMDYYDFARDQWCDFIYLYRMDYDGKYKWDYDGKYKWFISEIDAMRPLEEVLKSLERR